MYDSPPPHIDFTPGQWREREREAEDEEREVDRGSGRGAGGRGGTLPTTIGNNFSTILTTSKWQASKKMPKFS